MRMNSSILDTEFNSIRERFESEMKKMEEEMNKFRSELVAREQNYLTRTSSSSPTPSSPTAGPQTHKSEVHAWLDGFHSPLIQDGDSGKELKLRFDVSQYAPEEIVVKTVDNKLQVHAKHEEKSENRSVYREYNREFLMPKGTNPELIKSTLSKDGILTVEAPLPALEGPKEHVISIDKQ
jgi:HSP20 family molecular chaperone IbpA